MRRAPPAVPKKSASQAYEDSVIERRHQLHRARVANTKSCVDCGLPESCRLPHVAKGPMYNSERIYAIEHENRLLVQRMTRIMNDDSCIDNRPPFLEHNQGRYAQRMRDLDHLRIEKENRQILSRIEGAKSSYPLERLERDNRRNNTIAARIGRYQRE